MQPAEAKIRKMMGQIADATGLPPDLAYAIRRTGLLVTDRNKDLLGSAQTAAWNDIGAVNGKVAGQRIGIIGLGGAGAYVLDFVAKTMVAEINLFDGDVFSQHNAFRAPGAPTLAQLQAKPQNERRRQSRRRLARLQPEAISS